MILLPVFFIKRQQLFPLVNTGEVKNIPRTQCAPRCDGVRPSVVFPRLKERPHSPRTPGRQIGKHLSAPGHRIDDGEHAARLQFVQDLRRFPAEKIHL